MKRILIINGSPVENGHVAQMLQVITDAVRSYGAEVECVNVHDMAFSHCKGCMACRRLGRCVPFADDDASALARRLDHYDGIVIGTPTYWANMDGRLKSLFDRMVYAIIDADSKALPQPKLKGRRVVIVTSCTSSQMADLLAPQGRAAIESVRRVFAWSGAKVAGTVVQYSSKKAQRISGTIIRRLNKLSIKLIG